MGFMIDEAFLPATLTAGPMTDEQFAALCSEHPDLFFEMTAEGELLIMPPTYSFTGAQNFALALQLGVWAENDSRGVGTDSSTGFVLPSGARRSPDAAWTSAERIREAVAIADGYWHLSPDFVIELRSKSDRTRVIREKMQEWIANGTKLAWLIDPQNRSVEIYQPDREPELLTNPETITAGPPVDGFVLRMARIWNPLPSK